jgi:hypothetical protein
MVWVNIGAACILPWVTINYVTPCLRSNLIWPPVENAELRATTQETFDSCLWLIKGRTADKQPEGMKEDLNQIPMGFQAAPFTVGGYESHISWTVLLDFRKRSHCSTGITNYASNSICTEIKRSYMCLRHYATIRKVAGSIHDEVFGFFNWPNPSSRTMALRSTQTLIEMSTRNLSGCKGWPERKDDNLTAVCEPIV